MVPLAGTKPHKNPISTRFAAFTDRHVDWGQTMVVRVIGGVLLCLIGVVWFLQGIGTLGGSGMSGEGFWAFAGAVLVLVGIRLFLGALRIFNANRAGR